MSCTPTSSQNESLSPSDESRFVPHVSIVGASFIMERHFFSSSKENDLVAGSEYAMNKTDTIASNKTSQHGVSQYEPALVTAEEEIQGKIVGATICFTPHPSPCASPKQSWGDRLLSPLLHSEMSIDTTRDSEERCIHSVELWRERKDQLKNLNGDGLASIDGRMKIENELLDEIFPKTEVEVEDLDLDSDDHDDEIVFNTAYDDITVGVSLSNTSFHVNRGSEDDSRSNRDSTSLFNESPQKSVFFTRDSNPFQSISSSKSSHVHSISSEASFSSMTKRMLGHMRKLGMEDVANKEDSSSIFLDTSNADIRNLSRNVDERFQIQMNSSRSSSDLKRSFFKRCFATVSVTIALCFISVYDFTFLYIQRMVLLLHGLQFKNSLLQMFYCTGSKYVKDSATQTDWSSSIEGYSSCSNVIFDASTDATCLNLSDLLHSEKIRKENTTPSEKDFDYPTQPIQHPLIKNKSGWICSTPLKLKELVMKLNFSKAPFISLSILLLLKQILHYTLQDSLIMIPVREEINFEQVTLLESDAVLQRFFNITETASKFAWENDIMQTVALNEGKERNISIEANVLAGITKIVLVLFILILAIFGMLFKHGLSTISKPLPKKVCKYHTGMWTAQEHEQFMNGYERHGSRWSLVALFVPTRTGKQVRIHGEHWKKIGSPTLMKKSKRVVSVETMGTTILVDGKHKGHDKEVKQGIFSGNDKHSERAKMMQTQSAQKPPLLQKKKLSSRRSM